MNSSTITMPQPKTQKKLDIWKFTTHPNTSQKVPHTTEPTIKLVFVHQSFKRYYLQTAPIGILAANKACSLLDKIPKYSRKFSVSIKALIELISSPIIIPDKAITPKIKFLL